MRKRQKTPIQSGARWVILVFLLLLASQAEGAVVSRKVKLEPVPGEEGRWTLAKPPAKGRAPASTESAGIASPAPTAAGDGATIGAGTASPDSELMPPASSDSSGGVGVPAVTVSGAGEKPVSLDVRRLPVFKELIKPEMVESVHPLPGQKKRNWHLALGGDIGGNLSDRQVGSLALGVQWSFTDLFLRGRLGNALWSGMEVRPGTAEAVDGTGFPSFNDPDSEYNRIRLGSDSWSVMELQLGFGWRGNLLPVIFPDFSQAFHMTVSTGEYVDTANQLSFAPLLWGFEASSQWHLSASGAWALEGRMGYTFGTLQLAGAASNQLGRLPIRFLDAGLSLVLWF